MKKIISIIMTRYGKNSLLYFRRNVRCLTVKKLFWQRSSFYPVARSLKAVRRRTIKTPLLRSAAKWSTCKSLLNKKTTTQRTNIVFLRFRTGTKPNLRRVGTVSAMMWTECFFHKRVPYSILAWRRSVRLREAALCRPHLRRLLRQAHLDRKPLSDVRRRKYRNLFCTGRWRMEGASADLRKNRWDRPEFLVSQRRG